ncbi:MAG: hypothetical protein JW983_06845 [Elusimicrobia bacterium]|nr:hypothetical protein [Elusimicrobiota bacterium]
MKKTKLTVSLVAILLVNVIFCCSRSLLRADANGNITLEAKKPGEVQEKIKKIAEKYKVTTKNFYINTNGRRGKKSISITYDVPKADAPSLMNEIALLGEVISQNYNDYQNNYDMDDLNRKLKSFKQYLNMVISSSKPDPEIIKLFTQQIQNVESQIKRATQSPENANIRISINEKGYDTGSDAAGKKEKWLTEKLIIGIIIAVIFFILGLMTAKKTIKQENIT